MTGFDIFERFPGKLIDLNILTLLFTNETAKPLPDC